MCAGRPKWTVSIMTGLLLFAGGMGYVSANEEETKTAGSWDPVSREIIPKIMEKNGDAASIVRYVSSVSCMIDLELTSSTFPGVATGVMSYKWKDADNNGMLSATEIDIETEYVSMEGMSLVMGDLRRALENEAIQNTFNIFKSHHVISVKTDEGYKMKLKPKSAELVKRLGYTVVYATISSDFRIMKLRAKDDAGGEAVIDLKHQKAGDIWLLAGYSKRTESGDGVSSEETRTNTFAEVDGIPVISRVVVDTAVSTAMGAVTVRQVCTFRDWQIAKRDKPLSLLAGGFKEEEEAFKKPKPDKPKTEKDPDEELFGKEPAKDNQTPPKDESARDDQDQSTPPKKPVAPKVVSTEPASGKCDVAVDVGKITVKFDLDMNRESFSICPADDGEFPPVEGDASFTDSKTFVLKLGKLEAGKTYALSLNSESKKGFRSAGDIEMPLKPLVLKFTTAK